MFRQICNAAQFKLALTRLGALGLTLLCASLVQSAEPMDEAGNRFFRDRIEPVLKAHCYPCHSAQAKKVEGGLLLDSRAAARRGGDMGAAVVPGNCGESLLIQAIRHEGDLEMPP